MTPPIDLTTRSSTGAHIQTDIFSHGTQARPLAGERPYRRARVSSHYVLHAFAKKRQGTPKLDVDLARARLKELLRPRARD